jgi:VWFA-related protein
MGFALLCPQTEMLEWLNQICARSINAMRNQLSLLTFIFFICTLSVSAQEPKPSPEPAGDVVRINSELVQTAVSVFDKKGNFVDNLKREDFELRIDAKPQPIPFFSRIAAGTTQEQQQLDAVRRGTTTANMAAPLNVERQGRTIIFFIDDLHLSAASVRRTRDTILNFIEKQMEPEDLVAISSASGQIGFLQQFTENKAVLRAAVSRLNHRPYTVVDSENVPLTEYLALRIDQGDRDALTYYTNQLLLSNNFNSPGGSLGPPAGGPAGSRPAQQRSSGVSREMAERMVKERALVMLKQSSNVTTNTLASLQSLIRSSSLYSGRKLAFFVSDGFFLNDRNTGFINKLHEITNAAVKAGLVVYSLDARGLIGTIDATSNRADPEGKLSRANVGEVSASQDAMNALAEDTGGHALFDSDKLNEAVDRALKETSNYYLLAWRPSAEEQKSTDFKKLEVSIVGRTDLTVRLPRGFFLNSPSLSQPASTAGTPTGAKQTEAATPESDLRAALTSLHTSNGLPTSVAVSWVDAPDKGPVVTTSVQISSSVLDYGADQKQAAVDVSGVILNDQGKVSSSFKTRLTVNPLPPTVSQINAGVVYTYKSSLPAGLYQVRAAVRDEKSRKVGSASQWIEIPDLRSQPLTLSSLLVRAADHTPASAAGPGNPAEMQFSVDHRFAKSSALNFFVFIYNARHDSSSTQSPNITAQVEVIRNGTNVVSTSPRPLSTAGLSDLKRIPYGGQFPLNSLATGRYHLRVTIVDRLANISATQRLSFQVE